MILRARTVVPMTGDPIDNGAVAVSGRSITDVGRVEEVRQRQGGELHDLGEKVLLPGLINAHCHLDYTILRNKIAPPHSFADWIRAINAEKAQLGDEDYGASILIGAAEAQRFGTTTIINLTALPKVAEAITKRLRIRWFGELIDIRTPEKANRIVEEAAKSLSSVARWGLAPHAPYTASAKLYARCEEIAQEKNLLLTTHLAESREEMQMFREAAGPMFDLLKEIGRPMDDCGRETPLSLFLRTRALNERWIIAHLNELDSGDFDLLSRGPRFHVVHCPRSHRFFGHTPFALERLRTLGFNVCLGTDSLASNSSLSLFAEMRELLQKEPWLTPQEVVEMATIHAARAIGQGRTLGQIRAGFYADLIAIPDIGVGKNAYETIVAADQIVPWMMINGEVLSTS